MPLYDFKCIYCPITEEKLVSVEVMFRVCPVCGHTQERQLSAPGGIMVNGRMVLSEKQMKMIKEPVWQYPDGSVESAH